MAVAAFDLTVGDTVQGLEFGGSRRHHTVADIWFPPHIKRITVAVPIELLEKHQDCTCGGAKFGFHTFFPAAGQTAVVCSGVAEDLVRVQLLDRGGIEATGIKYRWDIGEARSVSVSQWDGSEPHVHEGPTFECSSPACRHEFQHFLQTAKPRPVASRTTRKRR